MSNRRKMTLTDKLIYFWYHFKYFLLNVFIYCIIVTIFLLLASLIVWHESIISVIASDVKGMIPIIAIAYGLGILVELISLAKTLNVLCRRKVSITDGYIFKKHTFKKNYSDSTTSRFKKVRAISNDKSVTTDWLHAPRKLFREDEAKVIIVVSNNKGIDIYR